jgi:hypothetical protein
MRLTGNGHAALSSTPAGPDRDLREFISQTEFRNSTLKTVNSGRELVQHSVFNLTTEKIYGLLRRVGSS